MEFKDFVFVQQKDKVVVDFLKIFTFNLKNEDLEKIGKYKLTQNSIEFAGIDDKKVKKAFLRLIGAGMSNLKNKLNNNPVQYIHQNSEIPLIGSLSFGIVDKGTGMLEIKPLTGCNIDCIFCSVDEGKSSKKTMDIVIEKDYLVNELENVLDYKNQSIDVYINPHGEPLLYADIVDLVADLRKLKHVKGIYIITNGTLLTQELSKELISAGLTGLNISVNSLDPIKAHMLANTPYNINKLIDVLDKIKGEIEITIAPVYLKGINEQDIEIIIKYCKKNNFRVGIQNFLYNKRGRKPVKEISMDLFFHKLKEWEEKYDISLIQKKEPSKSLLLPKPFCKGDSIKAEIFSPGRYPTESLAFKDNRIITITEPFTKKSISKVIITQDKNNVFYGQKKK